MPFIRIPGFEGLVYQPEEERIARKHPECADCFSCQMCSDERCALCLKRSSCRGKDCVKGTSNH